MAASATGKIDQAREFERVKKLLESKFYKIGDKCDLPIIAPGLWADWGTDFQTQVINSHGLQLVDSGQGYWNFIAFP